MLAATVGAIIAMIMVMIVNMRYNKNFGAEMKASLKIDYTDKPLGEVKLREMIEEERKGK